MYVVVPDDAGPLIVAYLAQGALTHAEADCGLPTFLCFLWAGQADYLARHIANHDLAGTADHAANQIGLEDARRQLTREQPGSDGVTAR